MFARVFDRLLARNPVADYRAARSAQSVDVAARFTRGNTMIQAGRFIDQDGLDALRRRGDEAMAALRRLRPAR